MSDNGTPPARPTSRSPRTLAIQIRDQAARTPAPVPPEAMAARELAAQLLGLELELDLTCRLHLANAVRDRLRGRSDTAEMAAFGTALTILQRINPEIDADHFFAQAAPPLARGSTHPAPEAVQ